MLIHPWDAAADDDEWRRWLGTDVPFGELVVNNLDRDEAPLVVPTHAALRGDALLVHLARPNPVWPHLEAARKVRFVVAGDDAYVPGTWRAREGGSSLDYTAERARLAKWQADKTEQDVEVRARRLLMADAVLQWVAGMVATVTARLVQIPDAVGHLVDPKYAPTVAAEVRRLIYEALEELSARGGPGALADLGDVEATADTDGEPVGGPVQKAVERKQRRARAVAN